MKVKEKVECGKIPIDYYMDVIKKLLLPNHKIVKRGIDIFIPEVCFFKDGQVKGLFLNKELHDVSLRKIHRNSVTPNLIQKIFSQRQKKYREDIKTLLGLNVRQSLTVKKKTPKHK